MTSISWNIEKIRFWLAEHKPNSILLSDIYIKNDIKLNLLCEKGHNFSTRWYDIKSEKSWCSTCAGNAQYTLKELQDFAIVKKGKLLSTKYINKETAYLWECSNGHTWKASWGRVNNLNNWCYKCSRNFVTLEKVVDYAKQKGGTLLSSSIENRFSRLLWKCEKDHIWESSADSVLGHNSWCPHCSWYRSEISCILLATEVFNLPFIKTRIYYDDSNSKKWLEFDGYNKEHKIAVEYNGIQHYKYHNFFFKTEDEFTRQQQRDEIKRSYCESNNISLIEIPYTCKNIKDYLNNIHKSLITLYK